MARGRKPAKKGKVAEQPEFDGIDGEWKRFLLTDLGVALNAYVLIRKSIEEATAKLTDAADKVVLEMRKASKDYIKPQIDGVFYEFEISKIQPKLKFKRSKV